MAEVHHSTNPFVFAPAQYSVSGIAGALQRNERGEWFWADGTRALRVRDMPLSALLPRFRFLYRYQRVYLAIAYTWRAIHAVADTVDPVAAAAVDALLPQGIQTLVSGTLKLELLDGIAAPRRLKVPGALVTQKAFDEVASVQIASWSAKDSVMVLAQAQKQSVQLFIDDDELQRTCDETRRRFFSAAAREKYGEAATTACEKWGVVEEELRYLWSAGKSRYHAWHFEHAAGRAWSALPPAFYMLEESVLLAFAQRFGPEGKQS